MKWKVSTFLMFLVSCSPLLIAELWSHLSVESIGAIYYVEEESRLINFVDMSQIDVRGK